MTYIEYVPRNFSRASLELIEQANLIIEEYEAQGFVLTLRQLYYQFVSRAIIPNKQAEYKRLGTVINDARLAGLISWDSITDRTRNLIAPSAWTSPASIIRSAARSYAIDKWAGQEYRVEVWVEKEALAGVIEPVCEELSVPWFACRGYVSQSEMHSAALRLEEYFNGGQQPVIVHLGDHDPSGIDMSRDIESRADLFTSEGLIIVQRIALNMDQVEQYAPPPNPAKFTDSRAAGYVSRFGHSSWELDALNPTTIARLIRAAVLSYRDEGLWAQKAEREATERRLLTKAADYWTEIASTLGNSDLYS